MDAFGSGQQYFFVVFFFFLFFFFSVVIVKRNRGIVLSSQVGKGAGRSSGLQAVLLFPIRLAKWALTSPPSRINIDAGDLAVVLGGGGVCVCVRVRVSE